MNDPLYNHTVFGPGKGKGGLIGKSDDKLIQVKIRPPDLPEIDSRNLRNDFSERSSLYGVALRSKSKGRQLTIQ